MAKELRGWLSGLGLGGHADRFADNGVDWDVLLELTEADLRELGLSLGDRKRLMKALLGLRQAAARPVPPGRRRRSPISPPSGGRSR